MRDKKKLNLTIISLVLLIVGLLIHTISETVLIHKNFTFTKGRVIKNICEGKNKSSTYFFEVNGERHFNKIPHCLRLNSLVNVAFDSSNVSINKLFKINNSYYFYDRNIEIIKNKRNISLEWVY